MGQSPSSDDYNQEQIGLPFLQGNADFTELHPVPRVWCNTANKITQSGDLLLSVRAPVGAVNIADQAYGIGRGLCAIRAEKTNPKLLFYFLLAMNEELNSNGTGSTYTAISVDDVRNIYILNIPLPEQQAIADFLDRKTAQIDTLIEKKQRQIDLLQEQRTALVNHAVTKGLNPDVRMKDEKSDFFPVIPQNWIKTRLGYLCNQIADGPHYSPEYVDDGIMFISARNVKVDRWEFDSAKYITEEEYQKICQRIIPAKGDVLYTKGGTTGVARVVDFDEPFQVWVHIIVLKPKNEKVNPYFLAYALNSTPCYEQSQLFTRGATNNDLGVTRVVNIELGLPPIDEQVEIVNHLNQQTEKIDNLIHSYENYIDLLQEYRTALISEAVTGKIDVRTAETTVHEYPAGTM